MLEIVGSDLVELGRGFMLNDLDWKDWWLPDGTPCKILRFINIVQQGTNSFLLSDDRVKLAIQKEGIPFFEQFHWPWRNRNPEEQDFSDLEGAFKYTMWTGITTSGGDMPLTEKGCCKLALGALKLRESTDRAIVGLFGGSFFEVSQFLYGSENYFMHMLMYPDACMRLTDALCDFYLPRLEKWINAVGPYIDVIMFGDDFGSQNGPLISPEMNRRYFKPWHEKLWLRTKELAPHLNIQIHCCGGVNL